MKCAASPGGTWRILLPLPALSTDASEAACRLKIAATTDSKGKPVGRWAETLATACTRVTPYCSVFLGWYDISCGRRLL